MRILIHGNDSFRSKEYLEGLLVNYPIYKAIDCSEVTPDELIQRVQTVDFFNDISLYIIRNISIYKNSFDVINIIEDSPNKTFNTIYFENTKLAKNTKLYKFFDEKDIHEFDQLNKVGFKKYIKLELQKRNIEITPEAFDIFSEYLNNNSELFNNELSKLILLNKGKIDVKDIVENIVNNKDTKIWEFIDNFNLLQKTKTINNLNNLLQHEDINYIIAMLNRNIKLIIAYKYLYDVKKLSKTEISKTLGVAPFILNTVSYYSNRTSIENCKNLYGNLVSIDKESKISNGNMDHLLNLYIIKAIDNII